MGRVERHPVLAVPDADAITFFFEGKALTARKGEVISSALFAHGIRTFGFHHRDHAAQGIFCANGQCAQCLVMADGLPVKACMEPVVPGMQVQRLVGLPRLPEPGPLDIELEDIESLSCDLLVIGAGPAGLGAAIEAAHAGLSVIVVDDKEAPGGKLVLQTHTFFGSATECYAGTRGVDIARILAAEAARHPNLRLLDRTMAVGVYVEGKVGIVSNGRYKLISPRSLLVAAGAREKALIFPGCDLPGVYGAGAFQTLLNRDLVRPSERLFVIGGGNVGIIAAYHALQAGIQVVGLVEGLPEVGGYRVHADKLVRHGVPIYTSTTVVSANGGESVESVTVATVDRSFRILPGTERTYECDTLLVAVGLSRINELHAMAVELGMDAHLAGDAQEIAEASAAMFSGRLAGRRIARSQGRDVEIPAPWEEMVGLLKSKPGREDLPVLALDRASGIFPVLRCVELIPCNPCAEVCPQDAIRMPDEGDILSRPELVGICTGCGKCVAACPGLAITLVDLRDRTGDWALVTLPFEMLVDFEVGESVPVVGFKGDDLGTATVVEIVDKSGPAPCRAACPADVRAQGYIQLIRRRQYSEAAALLRRDLPLPSVCGRVCYHPCEEECARAELDEAIAICALKRFVSDWAMARREPVARLPITRSQKVAVIGSGPAGLACANELIHRGYPVTVFEAQEKAGGMLRYGIPAYRLPKEVLDYDLGRLEDLGIEIRANHSVEDIPSLAKQGYAAFFIGTGAPRAARMGVPGEELGCVVGMLEFLDLVNRGDRETRIQGSVAVIGGGNSAMDAARAAIRLRASAVRVVYRRSREQMPAHAWEIEQARAEGVSFDFLAAPVEVLSEDGGEACTLRCIRMELGEEDSSGRPRPIPVEGSQLEIRVDMVIPAIGQRVELGGLSEGLRTTSRGAVEVDPTTQETSARGVFAGGDVATGAATVVQAIAAGKRAAQSIDRYLRGADIAAGRGPSRSGHSARSTQGIEKRARARERQREAGERSRSFDEIVATLSEEEALREAERCLGCGLRCDSLPGTSLSEGLGAGAGAGADARGSCDRSVLVTLRVDRALATRVAGIRVQDEAVTRPVDLLAPALRSAKDSGEDVVVCRCERVTRAAILEPIRSGVRDMNQLKAMLGVGMGACAGKTCGPLIEGLFRGEGIPAEEVVPFTERPLVAEVPMGMFAGVRGRGSQGGAK